MPNRDKNKNTGRKINVLKDQLGITGDGIYAVCPFENQDRLKRAPIKIGESNNLPNRIANYTGFYVRGVYVYAALFNIPYPKNTRSKKVAEEDGREKKRPYRRKIEKFIYNTAAEYKGSKRIYSTDRVRNVNAQGEGETEFVFATQEAVFYAFKEAQKKYGGQIRLYERTRANKGPITDLNGYIGKIVF